MDYKSTMKSISVIIVTYNSTHDIKPCLKSIYDNNDIGDKLEVIVVDNCSSDIEHLREILSKEFSQVILVENKLNGGYGQGNNIGIHQSSAPIIMIMNPDVRLFKPIFNDAICSIVKLECAMLGMKQYETYGVKGLSFVAKTCSFLNLIIHKFCIKFDLFNPDYLSFSGACFFLVKKSFEKIGLFDENIFMYGEEFDINTRMLIQNMKICYNKEIGYIHPMHQRDLSLTVLERGYKSFLYNYKKHKLNLYRGISQYISYYKLLRFRSRKNIGEHRIYSEYIEFLKLEKEKYRNYSNK
jgi:GT2 family glycosyltransferase